MEFITNIYNKIINYIFNKPIIVEENNITAEDLFKEEKESHNNAKCNDCAHKEKCYDMGVNIPSFLCKYKREINLDESKPTILLMDDNVGIISFLEDDLHYLDKVGIIKLSEYNILKFTTKDAAFEAISNIKMYKGYNTVYAILDITLGGSTVDNNNKTVVYDGVDVFIELNKVVPDFNYIFFTGNKLNPDIKKNEQIINKFFEYTGEDINTHILFKTSLSREQKREFFSEFFSKGKK